MMPLNELSSSAFVAGFEDPVKSPSERDLMRAWERAGVYLNDTSKGLNYKLWTLEAILNKDTALYDVIVSAPGGVSPTEQNRVLFSMADIASVDLAFDQNMNPVVAYMQGANASYYWYDPVEAGYVHSSLPAGCYDIRCTMDERRNFNIENSDVTLAYLRAGNLCVRYQRNRYDSELILIGSLGAQARLVSVARNRALRLQWHLRFSDVADPRAKVVKYPYLADIVGSLCEKAGIARESLSMLDLYDDTVVGYLVASTEGVHKSLEPLSQAFMFDPTEYDKKLRFLKRGRDVEFTFTHDDLSQPMKQTRVDETKLPIRVDVNHVDPDGAFAKNKQTSYRKSNLVKAKGNETLEFGFALTADQAATIALQTIKKRWHEPMSYEWSLPLAFTAVMPGDIGLYTDESGSVIRIRVDERNEADGLLKFKGTQDGGVDVYNRGTKGQSLPPPTSTTPGLVGETRLEILNLPPLRDQDDELGVYIAMAGSSSAWYGASLEISTDGGVNFVEAFQNEIPATLGDTETELLEEISAEYPSRQTLVVKTNFGLESADYSTLLTNYNRAVVGDEVIQFQTAMHLGDNRYQLGGIIRGRYNTKPEHWAAGTRFVLIDTSLTFLQAQQWMLGKEIQLKAVSYGTDGEDSVPLAYDFDIANSQLEWPPHHVVAVRDGGNNVAVSWIGRGRLGIETAPTNGKYFTGYKVRFSDGFTANVGANVNSYTRSSTPAGVTVQVCGTNSITGDGEYSKAANT